MTWAAIQRPAHTARWGRLAPVTSIGGGQNAALSQAQIDAARAWVQQQYGADNPFRFDGTDFNGLNDPATFENFRPLLTDILGAGQAMGYNSDALGQIWGYSPGQITDFRDQYFPDQYGSVPGYQNNAVNQASLTFANDQGWSNPDMLAEYRSDNGNRFGWSGGADGGYTDALRTPFGTVAGEDTGPRLSDRLGGRSVGGGGPGRGAGGGGTTPPGSGGTTYTPPPGYQLPMGVPGMPQLSTSYTPSPYLTNQIAQVGNQISDQFNTQILPGIRSNSIATGGYGGSRQGIAEGRAAGDAADAFNNASMNLLAGDYTGQMNRNLQQYGYDQNYGLGLGQLALGNQGQQLGFYAGQRAQDFNELMGGAQLYNMGTQGFWNPLTNANSLYSRYTGFGTDTSNTNGPGGGWLGAAGGLLSGAGLAGRMGWW
jgi:hypothetical protein